MRFSQQSISLFLALVLIATPIVAAAADGAGENAPRDTADERWIAGLEVIEDETVHVDARWRVLPGAELRIVNASLVFAAPDTGIVAEPGSRLVVEAGALQGDGFLLHLEGETRLTDADVSGARAVVLQPRPATDAAEAYLAHAGKDALPAWHLLRGAVTPDVRLTNVSVTGGAGPALVLGAPRSPLVAAGAVGPVFAIDASDVSVGAGPAILCHETVADPGLASGTPSLGLTTSRVDITNTRVDAAGGTAVHCPQEPAAWTIPARGVPRPLPPEAEDVADAVPAPAPAATRPGPAVLDLAGVTVTGTGDGLVIDAPTRLTLEDVRTEDVATALRVRHADAVVDATRVAAVGVGTAIVTEAGRVDVRDSALSGAHVGLQATAGRVRVTDTTFTDFHMGLHARTTVTVESSEWESMATCARVASGDVTLSGNTFRACGTGVLITNATGATVTGNAFLENADPLRVASPDPVGTPEHFAHAVTGNTVHGKRLAYVHDGTGVAVTEPVGHVVIAHSRDVRVTRLDVTHGRWHVVASEDVVLGAPTDLQGTLLATASPALADAFDGVWRDVDFAPYPGALKGPDGAADQGEANAWDQAWLLVDRFNATGRDARFVSGTLTAPTDAVKNWIGIDDLGTLLTVYGLSGRYAWDRFHLDHVWTEVEVAPGVWMEADPTFEQYDRVTPLDWETLSDIDSDRFYVPFIENATLGDTWVQHLPVDHLVQEVTVNQQRLVDAFAEEDVTSAELFGGRFPRPTQPGEEPTRAPAERFRDVPGDRMWSVHVRTLDPSGATQGEIDTQLATPVVYGKRLTVGGTPSTPEDRERILEAGGLSEVARESVAYTTSLWVDDGLVDLDGKWRLPDGSYEVRGERSVTRHPGDRLTLAVDVRTPSGTVVVPGRTPVSVGGTYSIVLDLGLTPPELAAREGARLNRSAHALENGEAQDVLDLAGQVHRMNGVTYFRNVDMMQRLLARQHAVVDQPLVAVGVTGQSLTPAFDGSKMVVRPLAPFIDVQSVSRAYPVDGDHERLYGFNAAAGAYGSQMEDQVFTELHNLPSVSTIKILAAANAEGQRIHQVNASNVASVLGGLSLPPAVANSIISAAYAGKTVLVHENEVTYYNWTGYGWAEIDDAGYAGWFIYGGMILDTVVQEPVLLRGGSGAQLGPLPEDQREAWDWPGYDDRQTVLDWTQSGWGLYGTATKPLEHAYRHGDEIRIAVDPKNPAQYRTIIRVSDDATVVQRVTVSATGEISDFVQRTSRTATVATVLLETGVDAHRIYFDPSRDGPVSEQHKEFGVSAAYNVASAGAAWGAAKAGGAGGAALCSLAPGVGTAACGVGGAVIGGLGGGYLAGRFKNRVVGWFTGG